MNSLLKRGHLQRTQPASVNARRQSSSQPKRPYFIIVDGELPTNLDERAMTELAILQKDPSTYPGGRHLKQLRPREIQPRVLVFGSHAMNMIMIDEGIPLSQAIRCGCREYEMVCSGFARTFWEQFFGVDTYFTDARDIPALIISSGVTRVTTVDENDVLLGVGPFLERVAKTWNIPLYLQTRGLRQPSEIILEQGKGPRVRSSVILPARPR